jgi:uncharacterized protein
VTAAALYPCRITHVRYGPVRRAFASRSYLWLVDAGDLPRVPWWLRPLASFRSRDHLGDPAAGIRANVAAYLSRHGIDLGGGQVLMLGHARVLGHVFNPLTVYWCHRADGTLAAVLAEVHNTYAQRHAYLLRPDGRGRAAAVKDFYVSPFLPPGGRYLMRLPEPGQALRLSVTLAAGDQRLLAAAVTGTRRDYTPWRLLGYALRYPWVTAQVSVRIRWQGIRIAARGVRVHPRPAHRPQEGVQ